MIRRQQASWRLAAAAAAVLLLASPSTAAGQETSRLRRRLPPAGDTKMSPCALAAQQQQQQQQQQEAQQPAPPKDESMGAAMGGLPAPPKGVHCKLQWIWTVSPLQPNMTDGSLGIKMLLDKEGIESDEATTPAFREWVPGQTYVDEMEFAGCPDERIHGFKITYYPYDTTDHDADPTTLSLSHIEALQEIPVLHESWSWSAADAGPTGGIGPGAGAPGTVPTFTVPSQGDYITTWF